MLHRPDIEDVRWQEPEGSTTADYSDSDNGASDNDSDSECIADTDTNHDGSKPRFLLPGFASSDGLSPVVGSSEDDWETAEDDTVLENPLPMDGMDGMGADESTAAVVASLTEKWEEQEAQVERRRNRRRKQSAEAAMELGRQDRKGNSNQHR